MMKVIARGVVWCLVVFSSAHAMDNYHWYRTPFFFGEPRLERRWLNSFDLVVGAGHTCKSRDWCGKHTQLLNLYGWHNMHDLGANVPNKSATNPLDLILIELERTPMRDCFAQVCYGGRFNLAEAMLTVAQNFTRGFFVQLALPIRHFKLSCVTWNDMSPTDGVYPDAQTPVWQVFSNQFANILQRYGMTAGDYRKQGVGDLAVVLGWTANYQDFRVLDYVDMTLKVGVLAPTAWYVNPDVAFDIPFGNNGHVGFPAMLDLAIGMYDWLTIGGHAGVQCFHDHQHSVRMKTSVCQNGFIKLAKGCARVQKGTIWETGVFLKADHVMRGLSFLCAYQFNRQLRDTLCPEDERVFDDAIVNSDSLLCGWQMHTLNFMIDYDFAREHSHFCPRLGVFYNLQVGGKRVFDLSTGGGMLGFDISCFFD